jgi:subtilisin family serine protease
MTSLRGGLLALALIVATTGSVTPRASAAPRCSPSDLAARAEVVVKLAPGHAIDEVLASYPVELGPRLLSSRGLHAVRATDPQYCGTKHWSDKLAQRLRTHDAVNYAESNVPADLSDGRYHAWPDGDPEDAGTDRALWLNQPASRQLQLSASHELSRGQGAVVAVLDTGAESSHPALAGKLLRAWDYVDDDPNPSESRNGRDDDGDQAVDESFGHGTFVAGTVALTAPEADVMPMRVLNSDGRGNLFVVAEAIIDAVNAGADVVLLAFGTETRPEPTKFEDAIKLARSRGVVVVASAGNESSTDERYPAALGEVMAVSALRADLRQLAAFSNSGHWVDVAAGGVDIVGAVPGGGYAYWNGTSVAAPFVAGQAALIRSRRPVQDATHTIRAIQQTTTVIKVKGQPDVRPINILQSLKYAR